MGKVGFIDRAKGNHGWKPVATLALCLGLWVEASCDMISRSDPCLMYLGLRSLV